MMRAFHRRPAVRRLAGTVIVLGLLLVVLQLVATPLARWNVRRSLGRMESFEGRVADVQASVFPPEIRLQGLRIIPREGGDWAQPMVTVRAARVALAWRKLADLVVVLDAAADEPVLRIVQTSRSPESARSAKGKARKVPDLAAELQRSAPLAFGEVHVEHGRVSVVDETRQPAPSLVLSDVRASVDNLTTRPGLAEHRPTTLKLTANVQRTGRMKVELEAHPFTKLLDFSGKMEVVHLAARDLNSLLAGTQKMQATRGTLDVFAAFEAKDGYIHGGVKPVAHDLELSPSPDATLVDRFKTWLADASLELFSEQKGDEKRVATVAPIEGRVTDPEAQLWPTVAGVVRNALVRGVSAGFGGVPPPKAHHEQSAPEQMLRAVTGKGQPKAQPQGRSPKK